MRRTAAVLLAVLTTAGLSACSSSDDGGKPEATATETVTATPSVSEAEAEAREACVEAWAQALLEDPKLSVDDEPAECEGLPGDDRLDRYMEGMQKRNAINRG